MSCVILALVILLALPLVILLWLGVRAMTVRLALGEWPHQSEIAKRMFDKLS